MSTSAKYARSIMTDTNTGTRAVAATRAWLGWKITGVGEAIVRVGHEQTGSSS